MDRIITTLLVSDDLDDHQSFTEAFQKISPSMVVIAVLSQEKALSLLASKKLVPDLVFLDLTSPDSDATRFLSKLKSVEDGTPISFSIYGNEEDLMANKLRGVPTFDKEYDFPQLVAFCQKILQQRFPEGKA
jgi:response regulator RpfG family c-di-GMP phosphodiesterase